MNWAIEAVPAFEAAVRAREVAALFKNPHMHAKVEAARLQREAATQTAVMQARCQIDNFGRAELGAEFVSACEPALNHLSQAPSSQSSSEFFASALPCIVYLVPLCAYSKFWTHRTKIYYFCDTSVREKAWCSRKRVAQAT